MNEPLDLLSTFSQRYALESFSDESGVLVDLTTGSYFKLNASAAIICRSLEGAMTTEEAIGKIAEKLSVRPSEAKKMIAVVKDDLSKGTAPDVTAGPLRYVSCPDGSAIFEEDGRPIFSIASGSQSVRFRASLGDLTSPLLLYLQALVPKLLALLEVPTLHASACQIAGELLAFSGKSGAGKTTTARAFERGGARLLSEDLVILSLTGESPSMYMDGEHLARDWAKAAAPRMEKAPDEAVAFKGLADAQRGTTHPLKSVWFVDKKRRTGSDLRLRKLPAADGTLALLGNGLLATSQGEHWRAFLRRSRLIAERTALSEATMPEGLARLQIETKRYIVNSASYDAADG
jgi:Coenzyme PQQ synthesis protein D (PqqD)